MSENISHCLHGGPEFVAGYWIKKANQLKREISTSPVSITQRVMKALEEVIRTFKYLSRSVMINVFHNNNNKYSMDHKNV